VTTGKLLVQLLQLLVADLFLQYLLQLPLTKGCAAADVVAGTSGARNDFCWGRLQWRMTSRLSQRLLLLLLLQHG
jgi:hypothetical protein